MKGQEATGRAMPTRRRRKRKMNAGVFFLWSVGLLLLGLLLGGGKKEAGALPETSGEGQTVGSAATETTSASTIWTASHTAEPWELTLVNGEHLFQEDREIPLTVLDNGLSVDTRCYPDLQDMMDDCRAAGLSPVICSAYRTVAYQQELYEKKVASFLARGMSQAEAEEEAGRIVALPGTSEHHLGLALDIVDESYQILDEGQEDTAVQKWLMENCWKYGFILRYPAEKGEITGIIYEPWHYRYVGKTAAEEIYRQGICLEEYLERQ